MNYDIELRFIPPLFLHGANLDAAEFRASSIRGQLRDWFRLCGGSADQEQAVFGGLHGGAKRSDPVASHIVVRIGNCGGSPKLEPTLPHKSGGPSAIKKALVQAFCHVLISSRNGSIPDEENQLFHRALKAWLLMGSIGQRTTRGGGNFTWHWDVFPMPSTLDAYNAACQEVLAGTQVKAALLQAAPFDNETDARKVITNTLGGPFPKTQTEGRHLEDIRHPLGYVQGSSRKVSSLRFRVCKIQNRFYILAIWDGREDVTGNLSTDMYEVINLLADHEPESKPIGLLLRKSSLYEK